LISGKLKGPTLPQLKVNNKNDNNINLIIISIFL
jgi:hypothetical protein